MRFADWEFKYGDVIAKFGESRRWVVREAGWRGFYVICPMLQGGFLGGLLDEGRTFSKMDCEKSFLKIGEYNWREMKELMDA